ncbi:MAG: acyl-[acyl-carrier-protein]--UDP-N-acetylglucosamine O-acyltransferase [Rhodothermaeota bacterium MED-G19]|nr:MAG: acyl-[acyl-carrier-protein]--UDP-N-acetylglucosamine O-acyltransferase [Rhodothermaeota bacterium MED-G19]
MIKNNTFIHKDSIIGKNTKIDPFSYIGNDVEIGDNCWIANNVTLFPGSRIGNNVKIFPGAVISSVPQDLKFEGEKTTVEIDNNTTIREFVTISRGTNDKLKTSIGKNCLIMAYSHIAHDCEIHNNCVIVNNVQIGGHVVINDYAIIGGGSLVHQFSKIGAHSMIGGGSLVRKDVPPYCKAGKNPLSFRGVNSIGLKRRNFSRKEINQIQKIYRIIYLEGRNTSQALDKIQSDIKDSKEKMTVLDFINNSERGIIKGLFD